MLCCIITQTEASPEDAAFEHKSVIARCEGALSRKDDTLSERCKRREPVKVRLLADIIESTAISASTLCMVHCLALPVLLFLVPGLLGAFVQSELFHLAALAMVAPAALAAFLLGYRRHGRAGPALLGVSGVICLVLGVAASLPVGETVMTVSGSLLLVAGHAWNWRERVRVCGASAHAACERQPPRASGAQVL